MLYSSIEIKPALAGTRNKTGWVIDYYDIPHQRENAQSRPYPLGFYHYKRSLGVDKAFNDLKTEMIRAKIAEINMLTSEILSLQKLTLPVKKEKTKCLT